jgi:VIT1/CCC1 family predicted Fe2+/Mn2+ transporter
MTEENAQGPGRLPRERVLNPVDRISEMLFGLLMALSFVGAISVAESGEAEIREMFIAALGCNLAWGLVDAVMYLVRTVTDRGRALALAHAVRRAADANAARRLLDHGLSQAAANLIGAPEIEAVRQRILAMPELPERPKLNLNDLLAALAIFVLVVAVTFPVVLPFAVLDDVGTAKNVSRAVALVMLFAGGLGLGRYAGYGGWKAGLVMVGLGSLLVLAINLLGG